MLDYINKIVVATRNSPLIVIGASPRAGIALLLLGKMFAAMLGINYLTPDHILTISRPVLRHRLILTPEAEIEGDSVDAVIDRLVSNIPVPR